MNKRILYITLSVIILLLIGGLLGLAWFINQQQQNSTDPTQDITYFGGGNGGSSSGGGGFFGGLFGGTSNTGSSTPSDTDSSVEPMLRQLYNLPIAGFVKRRDDAVRFVDRATGHIFEKELPDGTTTRVNQTTVPRVYNAIFVNDGTAVIRQYLNEDESVASVYSRISSSEPAEPFTGSVRAIVANQDGNKIAMLEETTGGSVLYVADPNGSSQQRVFESTLRNWNITWNSAAILVWQSPSASLMSSAFIINPESGEKRSVLRQHTGLSAQMSPNGEYILYSTTKNGAPALRLKELSTGLITSLSGSTLSDKCVWHPQEPVIYCAFPDELPDVPYPDAWYRGEVHFTDSVFKIDTETGLTEHVFSSSARSGISLDMENLTFDATGTVLFFTNALDQTLWSLTFPQIEATE